MYTASLRGSRFPALARDAGNVGSPPLVRRWCLPRPSLRLAALVNRQPSCYQDRGCSALAPCDHQVPIEHDTHDTALREAGRAAAAVSQQSLGDTLGFLALLALASCPAASAAEGVVGYNPEAGSETLKTLAGTGYLILVAFYFFRLFRKRAQTATSQPLASTLSSKDSEEDGSDDEAELPQPTPQATPLAAFIGAAQAGIICYLLFQLTQLVDGYFATKQLPEQYTAHNIAVLVQTVVRGLAYLITFIFGANALGLTGLMFQLLFFPELDDGTPARRPEPKERLPDVSITDDIFAIRRAFQEAERMGSKSVSSTDLEGGGVRREQ